MNRCIVFIIVEMMTWHYVCITVNSEPFQFPCVPPDPYPVLVQGRAGELFNFTKLGYTTNGTYTIAYSTVPPTRGPLPHIHHLSDEWFYFPEGGIVMYTSYNIYPDPLNVPGHQLPGAQMHRYHTQPGDLIYSSRFHLHGFTNEGNVTRPVVFVWAPDAISGFFFETGVIVTDGSKVPPLNDTDLSFLVPVSAKYGISQSASMNEYVATWDDDWQPALGWNANGSELIKLLTGLPGSKSIAYSTTCSQNGAFRISPPFVVGSLFYFLVTCLVFKALYWIEFQVA